MVERFTKEMYSNKTNVTIFIQDVNDNSPKFEQSFYEFEVEEEINAQLFISQVLNVFTFLSTKSNSL